MWSSGIAHEARSVKDRVLSHSESVELLENISAKILAFSIECLKYWPFLVKCGMDEVSAIFTFFTKEQKLLLSLL